MDRRFARLRPGNPPFAPGQFGVPSDGMCLNAFLLVHPPGAPQRILLGQIAENPKWGEVGAIDPARAKNFTGRWMLPSRQLQLLESPHEAARSIAAEQLSWPTASVGEPRVFSETYGREAGSSDDPHWDLHFVFSAEGPARPPRSDLWSQLDYQEVRALPAGSFARNHQDILALAGLREST